MSRPRPAARCPRLLGAILAGLAVLVVWTSGAAAQSAAPAPKSTKSTKSRTTKPKTPPPPTTRELQKLLEAQRTQLELQALRLAAADSSSAAQDSTIAALQASITKLNIRLDELEQQVPSSELTKQLESRLARVEAESLWVPELGPDVVSAGDFPGSIRIPRTDTAIKFGGRVRFATVFSLEALGTEDRFLTNSIPMEGSVEAGKGPRTNFSARASRLNFDLRTPAGDHYMRAFIEGDFAGTGNAFRLRHAFIQYARIVAGQTWSTFSDPEADAKDLDFEGVSSENITRQPLVRVSWRSSQPLRFAAAAETPSASITGGVGVNLSPDLVGRVYWRFWDSGHLQLASVYRGIRGEADVPAGAQDRVSGLGGSLSGVVPMHRWVPGDRVIFQVNGGRGTARYINDLNSLGGQDAVFDSTGQLHALPVIGWYIDYEHSWNQVESLRKLHTRSSLIWSYVAVNNVEAQPPDAYEHTNRYVGSLIVSPGPKLDVGLEYIWGMRRNKNGDRGHSSQIQVVLLTVF
jgi:hypothetical protein